MNLHGRIPRSRGGICGILLIVCGLWGGLAPFAGPYLHFGYTPDQTWYYSTGRLYFSVIPGAAAVLGGLLAAGTRSRGVGIVGGLLGALGGVWFVAGTSIAKQVLSTTYPVGTPIVSASDPSLHSYLEQVALFTGIGVLLVFFGALTMGRFSMVSIRDAEQSEDAYYAEFASEPAIQPGPASYPASTGQYPTASTGQYPVPGAFGDPASQETRTAQYPPSE